MYNDRKLLHVLNLHDFVIDLIDQQRKQLPHDLKMNKIDNQTSGA